MQTPWGDLRVSDAHVHFFSHNFFRMLAAQKQASVDDLWPVLGWEPPAVDPAQLALRWASELDRHGVTRSVLIASLPGDEASVEAAVAGHRERFIGYFMVNPAAPGAVERAVSALDRGLLRGVCLFPAMHCYSLQDERAGELIEAVSRRAGCVVFVHCGVLTVGVRGKLGLPSPFDMRYSNPIGLHALALRYPRVPFVLPHFGAGYLREALMLCDLCPNVHLDTSSSNGWMKYQEAGCDLDSVFRRALDVAGAGRLLFGTDSSFFPRGWVRSVFEDQLSALRRLAVSEEDAAAILGGNLERLIPSGRL